MFGGKFVRDFSPLIARSASEEDIPSRMASNCLWIASSWTSGGKIAKVDRVEWVTVPDTQAAMNALQSGDIDFTERASEYRQVGVRTSGLGCAGLFHAARTVARNSSTAFLRWPLSVRSARAELWTCPAAEPVSAAPRLTSLMLLSMWLAPCAAC